ncbi:hypothetical protein DFA_07447 [Cavenderia fasciculata]|uniref:Uncharacterized protein n=1 Tax=Cavenderia fasciculata TaxID=261658 RepID=F4PWF9_CACFS|nr:uncharacterized protein DFA_07447 [Cavenderia fasciculata]EGG20323.1 hypothetical protein DFA_07447 [Cavenderia fasciculata]|eukprot:XP_004367306.1 hypothetical protein DFA_07447 [Cavenderia fasciculata]
MDIGLFRKIFKNHLLMRQVFQCVQHVQSLKEIDPFFPTEFGLKNLGSSYFHTYIYLPPKIEKVKFLVKEVKVSPIRLKPDIRQVALKTLDIEIDRDNNNAWAPSIAKTIEIEQNHLFFYLLNRNPNALSQRDEMMIVLGAICRFGALDLLQYTVGTLFGRYDFAALQFFSTDDTAELMSLACKNNHLDIVAWLTIQHSATITP